MLNEQEILKLIENGENSYIEFKEDSIENLKLVKEMVALSNHKGGYILLGVADSGIINGLSRKDNEERIMNICSDIIRPLINPAYHEVTIDKKRIGVVEIERGWNKPYYFKDSKAKTSRYYQRYGSTTREVKHRDELQRLFQASQNIHFEVIPASRATINNLDIDRFEEFLKTYKSSVMKKETDIEVILKNLELAADDEKALRPTIAGLLLFGRNSVKKRLPQAGIMCVRISGTKITDKKEDVKFLTRNVFDNFDDAVRFFHIYNKYSFVVEGIKRTDYFSYPDKAFRELLANAIIHRDYTIAGSEISVWIYDDRVEIKSPGGVPNSLDIEKMRFGAKYHRNPVLAQFLSYAGIVEMMGQGIPKVDEWLQENENPELDIKEDEHEVVVTMYKR